MLAPFETERLVARSRAQVLLGAACVLSGLVAFVSYGHAPASIRAPPLALYVPAGLGPAVVQEPGTAPAALPSVMTPMSNPEPRMPASSAAPMEPASVMIPATIDFQGAQNPSGQSSMNFLSPAVEPMKKETLMGSLQGFFFGVAASVAIGVTLMTKRPSMTTPPNEAQDSLEFDMIPGRAFIHAAAGASTRAPEVSMKVWDHKVRGAEPPSLESLDLSNLKVSPGSHKKKTRKGRGISAGQGQTCGFGTDGQKARSGRSVRPGFEGGQIPLYRRLPKFVGRPMGPGHSKTLYGIVKVDALNECADGSEVDYASLQEKRIVHKSKYKLKKVVSGPGELTAKGLTVKAHAFTESAKAAIEGNGGTCVVLPKTAPAEKVAA